mgnify:CR=1 FL=1|jgi:hypothetical protein|tara:strand:+ start:209 stop:430 length:222 start_codon:yes stop_codon:yes gene_type:complete
MTTNRNKYSVRVEGVVLSRNSKRDDFRFAVVIFETVFQEWKLIGLRTTKQDGQLLLDSYGGYKKRMLIPVMPS